MCSSDLYRQNILRAIPLSCPDSYAGAEVATRTNWMRCTDRVGIRSRGPILRVRREALPAAQGSAWDSPGDAAGGCGGVRAAQPNPAPPKVLVGHDRPFEASRLGRKRLQFALTPRGRKDTVAPARKCRNAQIAAIPDRPGERVKFDPQGLLRPIPWTCAFDKPIVDPCPVGYNNGHRGLAARPRSQSI